MPRPRKRQKPVRATRCDTCVTKPQAEGGIELRPGVREDIQAAAITGVCQECHGDDNRTLCRGIRDYQLTIWARLGWIAEPTDEALAAAVVKARNFTRRGQD
jgi:hypothetical protein